MLNGKTVLIVGEDALMIYSSSAGKSKRLGILMWDEENLTDRLVGFLLREGGKKPVQILYDMLEQQYKKEMVPKLSPLDKRSYINRKLQVVFPSNPMRAAYFLKGEAEENLLKGNTGKDEGNPYIFASIPNVMQFDIIYDAIKKSELQLIGIGFLPVEATQFITKLSESKMTDGVKAKWNVLLSVHESGGLRQIITKNGELALTRLTAISADGADAALWGQEAGQEFKSTLSYLLRFGYSQDQSMNIFIVNESQDVLQSFKQQLEIQPGIFVGSASELGRQCGLKMTGRGSGNVGDGIHAAWATKARSLKLPVSSRRFAQVQNVRRSITYAAKACALAVLVGAAFVVYQMQQITSVRGSTSAELERHAALQIELGESEKAIPTIVEGVEFEKIISLLNVYDRLESNGVKSLAMIHAIANTMPANVRLNKLELEIVKNSLSDGDMEMGAPVDAISMNADEDSEEDTDIIEHFTTQQKNAPYEISLEVGFPDHVGLEEAVNAVKIYHGNLNNLLEGYEVLIKKQVANLSSTTDFTEDLTAKINSTNEEEEEEEDDVLGVGEVRQKLDAIITINGEGQ